jgi:hypothetical protein
MNIKWGFLQFSFHDNVIELPKNLKIQLKLTQRYNTKGILSRYPTVRQNLA